MYTYVKRVVHHLFSICYPSHFSSPEASVSTLTWACFWTPCFRAFFFPCSCCSLSSELISLLLSCARCPDCGVAGREIRNSSAAKPGISGGLH